MIISDERFRKLPVWIRKTLIFMERLRVPGKIVCIVISVMATIWFLIRVIPKPSRATYPCMQIAAPMMSGFVLWIIAVTGAAFAFKKRKTETIAGQVYCRFTVFCSCNCLCFNIYASVKAKTSSGKLENMV